MFDTQYIRLENDFPKCSYCYATILPDDDFDEYGGYNGCAHHCDCKKALLEIEMYKEIEVIKNKYSNMLTIDTNEINRIEYEDKLESLKRLYFDEE